MDTLWVGLKNERETNQGGGGGVAGSLDGWACSGSRPSARYPGIT